MILKKERNTLVQENKFEQSERVLEEFKINNPKIETNSYYWMLLSELYLITKNGEKALITCN